MGLPVFTCTTSILRLQASMNFHFLIRCIFSINPAWQAVAPDDQFVLEEHRYLACHATHLRLPLLKQDKDLEGRTSLRPGQTPSIQPVQSTYPQPIIERRVESLTQRVGGKTQISTPQTPSSTQRIDTKKSSTKDPIHEILRPCPANQSNHTFASPPFSCIRPMSPRENDRSHRMLVSVLVRSM